MGKWIAAILIFILFILPAPLLMLPDIQTPLANFAMSWFAPKSEEALGRRFIEDVRQRKFMPVEDNFEAEFVTPQMPGLLAKVAALFPSETPQSVKQVGVNTFYSTDLTTYRFTYEYQFAHRWLLAEIILHRRGGKEQIYGIHVQPIAQSLEQANALTLAGKGQDYYVFAGAAVLLFLFWLVSVYACLFTPMARRKWLWVIFVMIGVAGLNLNWTTGQIGFVLLTVSIPAVRLWHDFYGPWIFQFTIPLGAIVFWFRRDRLMEEASQAVRPDLRDAPAAGEPV